MKLAFWKRDKPETRSSGTGYTAAVLSAREAWISGQSGLGELTGCVQSCVSLWEHGLSIAETKGTDLLTPHILGIVARSLALRGECVLYASPDRLIPASDWELSTQYGQPRAYRLSIGEAGGGRTVTALAAEVLHFRIGADASQPWTGTAPLKRASISASMLHAIESALAEAYENMPLGTSIVPFPESPETDLQTLGAGFRGKRGRILLRESTNVTAAGGPAPSTDWRANDLTPDLSRAMTTQSLEAARASILAVYGVLPALFDNNTTGPLVREGQRHLATWVLQPIAHSIAHEASQKLGQPVTVDVLQPLAAFDVGARSRSMTAIVQALSEAKAAGIDIDAVKALVNWDT